MKGFYVILLLLISPMTISGQEYSNDKTRHLIEKLTVLSTDSPSFYSDTTYLVVDDWTDITIYEKENHVDNKVHKVFLKIVRRAKIEDLIKMSNSDYPNIRVYAFWALLKHNRSDLANKILVDEASKKEEKVWFDSFGDLVLDFAVTDLMKELIRIENHI